MVASFYDKGRSRRKLSISIVILTVVVVVVVDSFSLRNAVGSWGTKQQQDE
jgi:hypothetical protein